MEDRQDMVEIEARLYSQIHHDSSFNMNRMNQPYQQQPRRIVSNSIVVNSADRFLRNPGMGRYFRMPTPHAQGPYNFNRPPFNQSIPPVILGYNRNFNVRVPSVDRPRVLAPYTPYVRFNQSFNRTQNITSYKNNFNKRNNKNTKNNNNNNQDNKIEGILDRSHFNFQEGSEHYRKGQNYDNSSRSLDKSLSKQQKMGKYLQKKKKANEMRSKKKSGPVSSDNTIKKNYTIELLSDSNESDFDEVVEVPTAPPELICLEDSENESNNDVIQSTTPANEKNKSDISRPISPTNSVISDDFIISNDRLRCYDNENMIILDDLEDETPTVDSVLNQSKNKKTNESCADTSGIPSTSNVSSSKEKSDNFITPKDRVDDYQVSNTSIRATDVYESESSDLPESIYCRTKNNEIQIVEDDSNGSMSELNIKENRTKKLRKRKSSGSNKGSDHHISSSDEEMVDDTVKMCAKNTSTPYIIRGAAVEKMISDEMPKRSTKTTKPKVKRKKLISAQTSDDDFISMLENICCDDSENSGSEKEEEIMAKDLVDEASLKDNMPKLSKKIQKESNDKESGKSVDDSLPQIDNVQPTSVATDCQNNELLVIEETNNIVDLGELFKQKKDTIKATTNIENTVVATDATLPITNTPVQNIRNSTPLVDDNDLEIGWNNEMKRFYKDSWGGENFELTSIQNEMSGLASEWQIKREDHFPLLNIGKYSKARCLNCNELGHLRFKCPLPIKKVVCRMCGQLGHRDPRCPNKICLNCGSKNGIFSAGCNNCKRDKLVICNLCRLKGHSPESCPDVWRRYHSTTTDNTKLVSKIEYSKRKNCSICARSGHLAENCNSSLRFLTSNIPTIRVISHKPSYPIQPDIPETVAENEPDYNTNMSKSLIYSSYTKEFNFKYDQNVSTKSNTIYGRFVDAVKNQNDAVKKHRKSKKIKNVSSTDTSHKLLINPFAKNSSKIHEFSFCKEMDKLIASKKKGEEFNLEFITNTVSTNKDNVIVSIEEDTNQPSTSKGVLGGQQIIPTEKMHVDSDSNYSFSEYYNKDDESKLKENIESNSNRNKELKELDFIPIDIDSEDDDVICEVANSKEPDLKLLFRDKQEINAKPGNRNPQESNTEKLNETGPCDEVPCDAKIYLSKEDSHLLLSFSGKNILSTLSPKYKITISMTWKENGNMLVIHGLPSEQDKFHKDLTLSIQSARKEIKRKQLEASLQVPKSKQPLVRFIEEKLDMLKINLGDVKQLFRKMNYHEPIQSKQSQKQAERARRVLNMILMGQVGLREGKDHLNALKNILVILKSDDNLTVTIELRNEIFQHIKYIFTPFEHPNYLELIKEYIDIKFKERNNIRKSNPSTKVVDIEQIIDVDQTEPEQSSSKNDTLEPPDIILNIEKRNNFKKPSGEWSKKCQDVVDKCRELIRFSDENRLVGEKLDRVYEKANENRLTVLDYQALLQIQKTLEAKLSS